jgi:hypothetical protein
MQIADARDCLRLSVAAICVLAHASGPAIPAECEVGTTRQLFLDDYVIAQMDGVKRVVNQPQRYPGNPIMGRDFHWEESSVDIPLVVLDPHTGLYHMYYRAYPISDQGDGLRYTCYARSTDGIHWEKPKLGFATYMDGTTENNILFPTHDGYGSFCPQAASIDPDPPSPDRRFVMVYKDGASEMAAVSPDGLHWTNVADIGDFRRDTLPTPPTPNPKYLFLHQNWVTGELDHRYRGVWRSESNDLVTWGGAGWAFRRLPDDSPDLEFYSASTDLVTANTYCGLHLAYVMLFPTDPAGAKLEDGTRMAGPLYLELAVSRDTINWTRVGRGQAFLPLGPPGSWDDGMIVGISGPFILGDEMRFYYGGWDIDHAETNGTAAIGMATLRRDGFVSIEPEGKSGSLLTKPFRLEGDRLVLNADAGSGKVLVEVIRPNGRPIRGFAAGDRRPITSDGLDQEVTWTSGRTLAELHGKRVALRFRLEGGAKLYAFQVQP